MFHAPHEDVLEWVDLEYVHKRLGVVIDLLEAPSVQQEVWHQREGNLDFLKANQ